MNNIDRIRKALPGHECSAILITSPVNRLFATGFSSSAGALLITMQNAWLFTDTRYFEAARGAVSNAEVLLVTAEETYSKQIKALLDERELRAIGFEDGYVTYSGYLEWQEKLEVELIRAQNLLNELRASKSPLELDKMIKAQRLAEKSFEEILPLINTGITEKQLAAELLYRFMQNGADDKAFDTIAVSGPKSSMPHGVPGNEKIGRGFLTIDFGVRLDGWCSDTTRTICIGKPDDEMINIYNTVLEAQKAGIASISAGVSGKDVDAAARAVIENAGYGEYFGHGFGHSLGLEVHESLKASTISKDILPCGAVMSAEPGIYIPGRYGVRIEDVVYITQTGCDNITCLSKDLIVL